MVNIFLCSHSLSLDLGFIEHCPWEFQRIFIPQILAWTQEPKFAKVLFSTEENLRILLEIFRQGFQMPISDHKTMNDILSVLTTWIEVNFSLLIFSVNQLQQRIDQQYFRLIIKSGFVKSLQLRPTLLNLVRTMI